jgi:hypothetical protein
MKPSVMRFSQFWQGRSLPARKAATQQGVADFEQRYGVTLPEDMREFWLLMDGTEGASADDLTFWAMHEFRCVTEVFVGAEYECLDLRCPPGLPHPSSYFVFTDYLVSSFCYAVGLGQSVPYGDVLFLDGTTWYRCADSFSMFLDGYIREAAQPHFCGFLPELMTQ